MCRAVEQYGDKKMQAGMEAGMQAGIQAGGKAREKALVISMLENDMTYEQISKIVKLPIDEIKKIENEES